MIRARAAELGFTIAAGSAAGRVWNTFDAHRLLHWAGLQGEGRQRALKLALFEAYFTDGRNPGDHQVLTEAAAKAGLDPDEASQVLSSDLYTDEVRAAEHFWQRQGISGVPAIIIDERYLISGGQPADAFEQALRRIAAEAPVEWKARRRGGKGRSRDRLISAYPPISDIRRPVLVFVAEERWQGFAGS